MHHDYPQDVRTNHPNSLSFVSTSSPHFFQDECIRNVCLYLFIYTVSVSFVNDVFIWNAIEIFRTKLFPFFASLMIIWHQVHLLHLMFNWNQTSLRKKPEEISTSHDFRCQYAHSNGLPKKKKNPHASRRHKQHNGILEWPRFFPIWWFFFLIYFTQLCIHNSIAGIHWNKIWVFSFPLLINHDFRILISDYIINYILN